MEAKCSKLGLNQINKLLIIGAGELAIQISHFSQIDGRYEVVGYIDNNLTKNQIVCGKPVLGTDNDIMSLYEAGKFDSLIIGIGYNLFEVRDNIYERFKERIPFATIIAQPFYIDTTAKIGEGTVIYPGVVIDKDAIIEPNVILNFKASVGHNSIIGQSSFVAGSALTGGFVRVGKRCFLGIGCLLKNNISVSDDILIGIGSVVIRSLKKKGTYFGNPAKYLQ